VRCTVSQHVDTKSQVYTVMNHIRYIAPDGPLTVVIDAADVLCADLEAPSKSYALISSLLSNVLTHPSESHPQKKKNLILSFRLPHPYHHLEPSRLVLHFSTSSSPLRDLVLTPRLSLTLAHIVAHPPALLTHLATAQLTPPPPLSAPDRFWRVFAPLSARAWEVERIVLGPGGAGPSGGGGEIVLEVLTRAPEGRRGRNVERELEGWTADGPCPLSDLDSLKPILEDDGKDDGPR
jgi:elongator complex protein 5